MSKLMARIARWVLETNDARRMSKQRLDTSDLSILADIPYIPDGTPEHLLDIYRPKHAQADLPVIVNIHGGGLVASYKTVDQLEQTIERTRKLMNEAAKKLDFIEAAQYRDELIKLQALLPTH